MTKAPLKKLVAAVKSIREQKINCHPFPGWLQFSKEKMGQIAFSECRRRFLRRQLFGVGFSLSFQISYTD